MTLLQTLQIAIVVGAFSFTASCSAAEAAPAAAEPVEAAAHAE